MRIIFLFTLFAAIFPLSVRADSAQCSHLKTQGFPDATVIQSNYSPGKCDVIVKIWPALSQSASSFITLHLWLPDKTHWNGRFLGVGNGGYSPRIPVEAMQPALSEGYAVAASDTGHQSEPMTFVLDAPERIDYWGRTSVHELSKFGVKLATSYYGKAPHHRYFEGCSTGGHQALTAAQFYPDDYDGIIAGAPGHNRVSLNAAFLWLFQQTHDRTTNKPVFSATDLRRLETFFVQKCDASDGAKDGLLSAPQSCKPDLTELQCTDDQSQACFTTDQLSRIQNILSGPVDPVTKEQIYPGFGPGTENAGGIGWRAYWANPEKPDEPARADFWRYWAFHEPDWQPWEFDWHDDIKKARAILSPRIDATQTNLNPFFSRGGKLIMYHGLADPIVPFRDSLDYARAANSATHPALQLYLVPGMGHCAGGKHFTQVAPRSALIRWVELDERPSFLPASRIIDGKTTQDGQILPARLD